MRWTPYGQAQSVKQFATAFLNDLLRPEKTSGQAGAGIEVHFSDLQTRSDRRQSLAQAKFREQAVALIDQPEGVELGEESFRRLAGKRPQRLPGVSQQPLEFVPGRGLDAQEGPDVLRSHNLRVAFPGGLTCRDRHLGHGDSRTMGDTPLLGRETVGQVDLDATGPAGLYKSIRQGASPAHFRRQVQIQASPLEISKKRGVVPRAPHVERIKSRGKCVGLKVNLWLTQMIQGMGITQGQALSLAPLLPTSTDADPNSLGIDKVDHFLEDFHHQFIGDLGRPMPQELGQFGRERNDHFLAFLPPPASRTQVGQSIPRKVQAQKKVLDQFGWEGPSSRPTHLREEGWVGDQGCHLPLAIEVPFQLHERPRLGSSRQVAVDVLLLGRQRGGFLLIALGQNQHGAPVEVVE